MCLWCDAITASHRYAFGYILMFSSVMWWIKGCEESEILNLTDAIWCYTSFLVFPSVSCPHQGTNPGEPSRKASLMASRLGDGSWKLRCRTAGWLDDEVRKLQNQRPLGWVMTDMVSWMLERQWNGLMWTGQSAASQNDSGGRRSMNILRLDKVNRRIRRTSRGGLNLELKNEAMTAGTTLVENDPPCFTDLRAVMLIKCYKVLKRSSSCSQVRSTEMAVSENRVPQNLMVNNIFSPHLVGNYPIFSNTAMVGTLFSDTAMVGTLFSDT